MGVSQPKSSHSNFRLLFFNCIILDGNVTPQKEQTLYFVYFGDIYV